MAMVVMMLLEWRKGKEDGSGSRKRKRKRGR
jgi:hypothetical protein